MATPTEADLMDLIPPEAEIVRRIVQEVRQYPRIRQPLLRFLTADDFDELIAMSRENADGIKLILERMGVVENRMGVMEERLASVEESVARIPVIESAIRRIDGSLGQLRGEAYEDACAAEIIGILDGYMDEAVLADREKIRGPFLDARRNGLISREQFLDGNRPDIIARAGQDAEEAEALAVVEVSITFNREDLENAARRAELIGRVTGVPTAAYLVTLYEWPAEMDTAARDLGVTIIQHFLPKYAD
ncbi:MAG: hypothetical protein OXI54_00700 [Chloroflexota bacterium]|nr:hypothetical protein [Chloroflexota bacterium]MDE2682659.1 hypothetical protein [Chloroflexota bacterium]